MYRRHVSLIAIASLIVVGAGAPATAQTAETGPAERAQAIYLEAMTLYRSGKYRSAAQRFEDAYRLFPDARLMYNIGRANEATGDTATAMQWFLRTAEDPKTSPELRQKAIKRLRVIEEARARSAAVPPESAASPLVVQASADSGGTSALGVSKWLTGGLGLGLLGGGAALFLLGLADEAEIDDARTNDGSVSTLTRLEAVDLSDRAEFRKTTGIILGSAGAALALTSIILFLADGGDDDGRAGAGPSVNDDSRTSVSIVPLDGGGAVWLDQRF